MNATTEQITAAEAYEALHVPALFEEWTHPILDAAGVAPGHRVLDVACGTGVLARKARGRVGGAGSVAGVDPDPGMLVVAGRAEPSIEWRVGTAEALPFPDGAFDAVVSQFGMMFFSDRAGAAREMLRVTRSGGRVAVAVWDALENTPAYARELAVLEDMAGADAAAALRAPFVLGDRDRVAALFEDAGAAPVSATTRMGRARFPSVRSMVEADLRGWLPLMGVQLSEAKIAGILEEAERALADFVASDGTMVFDSPAHIVTAAKPAA